MNESPIKKSVMEQITKGKIILTPKWQFKLKKWLIWVVFSLSILVGALGLSVSAYMLKTNDWDIYPKLGTNIYNFLFSTLPYVWILVFGTFSCLAYYNFRHTQKGYRYNILTVVMINLLLTIILGAFFTGISLSRKVDQYALNKIPGYHNLHQDKMKQHWDSPEKGLIGGEVIKIESDKLIILSDFGAKEWNVVLPEQPILGSFMPKVGQIVQVMGEIEDSETFKAKEIRPWPRPFTKGPSPEFSTPRPIPGNLKENLQPMRNK